MNLLEQIGNFSLTPASVVRKLLISAENKNKHKSKITNINNDKDNKRKELII
ncbi:MAG: hypothetical protein LBU14_02875 [Candidatus Peribacteria bacterium]|nr:hypothetical protein [Candidatus Peribacteria bacterium]